MKKIVKALQRIPATPDRLERSMFDHYNGEAGTQSLVATYEAPNPLVLRPDQPIRLALTAMDSFTTDGSGVQTLSLSHSITESPQAADLYVFDSNGDRVSIVDGSLDYANDTFDYDDGGAAEDIAAYYISDDDVDVEIEKQAPSTHGSVSETVFSDTLSLLHQRDQDEQPRYFDVGNSPLERVVPTKWSLNVYAEGSYAVTFFDDATNSEARNAILSLPYKQGQKDVPGLSRAVAHDTVNRS